jgi:alkylhydroperoxidase family enzyme
MELAREALAPKPLGELRDSTMLAVASVPGKHPEEWRQAYPLWMAWPHATGAVLAVEMTAAQLRARLAEMDGHG